MYDKLYCHDVDNYIVLRVQKRESVCSFPIRFIWLNDISSYLLSSWNGFYSNKIVSDVHKSRVLTKSQKQVIKINISHERKEDKKKKSQFLLLERRHSHRNKSRWLPDYLQPIKVLCLLSFCGRDPNQTSGLQRRIRYRYCGWR